MSSGTSVRKRDYLRGFLAKLAVQNPSSSAATQPTVPARPSTPAPQTNDPSQRFLQHALQELTDKERSAIQEHVTLDISTTIQAAYDAAEKQKNTYRFKSVGDFIANADPVHIGPPWAGIRMLLEAAVADSRQISALVSGMDLALRMANRLQAYCTYYRCLPPTLTTDNLGKALISLYAHVLSFLAKAIQVYSSNTVARKARAFWQDSDIAAFEDDCDKLAGRADFEANNCDRELHAKEWASATQWKKDLSATLQKLDGIQAITSALDVLQVKVDLSKLFRVQEATHNSTVEEKLPRCLDGTRSQILHDITQWAKDPDGKLIYWLCGQAGTGKSTISRTIANFFDSQQYLGASFFFKRGEINRSNADHFFSTITAQLADMIPLLQAPVAAALDKDSLLCGRGIQAQFDKLLLQPLLSINAAHLSRNRFAIFIDALDECDRDTDIRMFLKLLAQVEAKSTLRLRIFLTSRPELPVRLGFRQLDGSLHEDVILEEVQESTIHSDIRAYFDNEFAKIRDDQLLLRSADLLPADWPSEQDRQTLVILAVPLFVFATTVCRFISESDPIKRLKVILQQQHSAGSTQLAKLYLPILDQMLDGKEEEEQQRVLAEFRGIVGPIILAADPLSVAALANLLGLDRGDANITLDQLHSVLQVPSTSHDPVRLLHLSFRDFLVDSKRKDKSGFRVSKSDTQQKLSHACLRRLSELMVLKRDICCVVQPGTRRKEVPLDQVATHIPSDVAYACSYWPLHFVKSGEELVDNGLVHRFLQQYFLYWLEALSWLGRLSSAIGYISDLLSITQDSNSYDVTKFLQDAKRFILFNRHVIDFAPLQTYHSAIIFTPMQSIVRNTFFGQLSHLWECLPKVHSNWSAEIQKLEGHDDGVTAVAFSPDGQTVASGSEDKTVRLWNARTGEEVQKLEGHEYGVTAVAFSPDGQTVASGSEDKTVRLWNNRTGKGIHQFKLVRSPYRLAFKEHGTSLIAETIILDVGPYVSSLQVTRLPPNTSLLALRNQWIQCQDQDLLWLPHEYRGTCSAIYGDTLVLGQALGAVSFFRVKID